MADNIDNLILEHLRGLRAEIASVKDDTREIKSRLVIVEAGIAGLRRDAGDYSATIADQHRRYDRITDRLDRIEQRLGLVEA
jgi:chromosome segregation ATPase